MSKNVFKDGQERRKEAQEKANGGDENLREEFLKAETRDEEPTKRLSAELPASLHKRFKETCQLEGKSMTAVLMQLVETYVGMKGNE